MYCPEEIKALQISLIHWFLSQNRKCKFSAKVQMFGGVMGFKMGKFEKAQKIIKPAQMPVYS